MNSKALPEPVLKLMAKADRDALGRHGKLAPERQAQLDAVMEKNLHGLFSQYLRLNEVFYVHSDMSRRTRSTKGTPDYIFCVNGQACAVEFKTMTGRLSEDQEKAIAAMRHNFWAVEVCTSLEQAIAFVRRFMK